MAHLTVHVVGAAVAGASCHLLGADPWLAVVGALAPDASLLGVEARYRSWLRSGSGGGGFSEFALGLRWWELAPYRLLHSWLLLPLLAHYSPEFAAGWAVHLLLDLPTHVGVFRQAPAWPLLNWGWPWTSC